MWVVVVSRPVASAASKPAPHPVHGPGSCRTTESGSVTCASVDPGCPGCPPGLRPLLRRNDFGAGFTNGESDDGGIDEFWLFCANCRLNSAISARNTSTIARSSAFSAATSS